MRRIMLVFSLVCTLPVIGQAQQRGGAAMAGLSGAHFAAPPAAMARVAPMHPGVSARPLARTGPVGTRLTTPPKPIRPLGWNHAPRRPANTPDPVFPNGNLSTNGYPVPGFGFDYTHFFATHPNAGRHHQRGSGFVVPFVDGGLYIPYPMYADQSAPEQQAQAGDSMEQAAPAEDPAPRETYSNPYTRPRAQTPPPEQAEYVFVRRDGTLIFAVAYSWINDRLQYVTQEGLRRTAPVNSLDLDATQQFNEQRGVPIRFPA